MNKYKSFSKEAQKQRKIERACTFKRPLKNAHTRDNQRFTTYLCPYCQQYHRTSAVPRWAEKS